MQVAGSNSSSLSKLPECETCKCTVDMRFQLARLSGLKEKLSLLARQRFCLSLLSSFICA